MSQDNNENVPIEDESLTNRTKEDAIETEKSNLTTALEKGLLVAKFPLPRDIASHKSEAFKIFHLIYDEENNPIQNWFSCSVCSELVYIIRSKGTAKLLRHKYFVNWKEHHSSMEFFRVDRNDLANILANVAAIGFSKGPINSEHIQPILPEKSSPEEW